MRQGNRVRVAVEAVSMVRVMNMPNCITPIKEEKAITRNPRPTAAAL
jgi:hypothetical protein